MSNKVDIIGCGEMGSAWLKSFHNQGANINKVIDIDKNAKELATEYNAEYHSDFNSVKKENTGDIWCIATPTQYHYKYLKESSEIDLDNVLVEKPTTIDPELTKKIIQNNQTQYHVDYIELVHPVVETITDQVAKSNFRLTQAVHWRGKYSKNMHPHARNDLVHDVSEISAIYNSLGWDISDIDSKRMDLETWGEKSARFEDDPLSSIYDVSCSISLSGSNNEPILLKGGFNQKESRRYFLWVDDRIETAYFGSTISRENLTPVAVRINGSQNIAKALHMCIEGSVRNDEEISDLISEADGKKLELDKDRNRMDYIASRILSDKISPTSLQTGIKIEEVIKKAYEKSNLDIYKRESEFLQSQPPHE